MMLVAAKEVKKVETTKERKLRESKISDILKFDLINSCIDHTGEYWYSEYLNSENLYEAGYFDHGCYVETKKFKTKENAVKWLEKMRKENDG